MPDMDVRSGTGGLDSPTSLRSFVGDSLTQPIPGIEPAEAGLAPGDLGAGLVKGRGGSGELSPLLSGSDGERPLDVLREILRAITSQLGFQGTWIALAGGALREAIAGEGSALPHGSSQGLEEFALSLLEKGEVDYLVVKKTDELPEELRGGDAVIIPVRVGRVGAGCGKVKCRFGAWSERSGAPRPCPENGFYPGECCFKRDVGSPVPTEVCAQCPLFPFAFVLVARKEKIDRGDLLSVELLRQRLSLVAQGLYNDFIIDRYNKLSLTLSRVTMKMGELLDFKKRMDLLLGTAMAMLGADRGSIFIYDEGREELKYVAWRNMPEHIEFDAPRKADTGIAAWVARNAKPLLLQDDVENEFYRGIDPSVKSAVSVPLLSKGEVFGVLNLSVISPGRRLCETDLRMVESLAYFGTAGIENAFLYHRMEERERLYRKLLTKMISAQEDERKKIASEIHDDTIQSLISSYYQMETVEILIEEGRQEEALLEMREIKSGLQRNIGCMRRLLFDLRPSILDDAGLVPALENYLDRMGSENGIRGILYVEEGMPRPQPQVEVTLYRFAQEILTNVKKHACAEEVTVQLKKARNRVEMRIRDDGVGFELDRGLEAGSAGEHFGIKSLMERVELVGGEMAIYTAPGAGTEVLIQVPDDLA